MCYRHESMSRRFRTKGEGTNRNYIIDERRPFGIGLQERVPNHPESALLKRQGSERSGKRPALKVPEMSLHKGVGLWGSGLAQEWDTSRMAGQGHDGIPPSGFLSREGFITEHKILWTYGIPITTYAYKRGASVVV